MSSSPENNARKKAIIEGTKKFKNFYPKVVKNVSTLVYTGIALLLIGTLYSLATSPKNQDKKCEKGDTKCQAKVTALKVVVARSVSSKKCSGTVFYTANKMWQEIGLVPGCDFNFDLSSDKVKLMINRGSKNERTKVIKYGIIDPIGYDVRKLEVIAMGEKRIETSIIFYPQKGDKYIRK